MNDNHIQQFTNKRLGATIRVIDRNGLMLFVLADVCTVTATRTNDMMKMLDDDEKGYEIIVTPGGEQRVAVVTEAGLYSVILRSRKPSAKAFRRWVTHEVLPAIREKGNYGRSGGKLAVNPQSVYELAEALLHEKDRREAAEKCIDILKPTIPLGTPSKANGRPRNTLVRAYPRTSRVSIEIPTRYKHLFNYLQMSKPGCLLEDEAEENEGASY